MPLKLKLGKYSSVVWAPSAFAAALSIETCSGVKSSFVQANTYSIDAPSFPSIAYLAQSAGTLNSCQTPFLDFLIEQNS